MTSKSVESITAKDRSIKRDRCQDNSSTYYTISNQHTILMVVWQTILLFFQLYFGYQIRIEVHSDIDLFVRKIKLRKQNYSRYPRQWAICVPSHVTVCQMSTRFWKRVLVAFCIPLRCVITLQNSATTTTISSMTFIYDSEEHRTWICST